MTKKYFIELANAIKAHNRIARNENSSGYQEFTSDQLDMLARFCKSQNSAFMGGRWREYINGECGPNGGAIKGGK